MCIRDRRHVGAQLTLSYDRKLITLTRNEMTENIVDQYVEIYHFADGQMAVRWKGVSLPYVVSTRSSVSARPLWWRTSGLGRCSPLSRLSRTRRSRPHRSRARVRPAAISE